MSGFASSWRRSPLSFLHLVNPRRTGYMIGTMPRITVDGKTIEAKPGQMILQACNDQNLAIPQYCYHPGLSIVASCRICLVEVEGIPKLVPSCQTPVRDGMIVHSKTAKT